MDWEDAGDRSLMEWQEVEEPDRVRKRKKKSSKRSRRQCGVNNITNIPPEKENSKRRVGEKYLLVGAPRANMNIDYTRMAVLDQRIQKAALMIEEISAIRAREWKLQ